jgi:hypothetical protein
MQIIPSVQSERKFSFLHRNSCAEWSDLACTQANTGEETSLHSNKQTAETLAAMKQPRGQTRWNKRSPYNMLRRCIDVSPSVSFSHGTPQVRTARAANSKASSCIGKKHGIFCLHRCSFSERSRRLATTESSRIFKTSRGGVGWPSAVTGETLIVSAGPGCFHAADYILFCSVPELTRQLTSRFLTSLCNSSITSNPSTRHSLFGTSLIPDHPTIYFPQLACPSLTVGCIGKPAAVFLHATQQTEFWFSSWYFVQNNTLSWNISL